MNCYYIVINKLLVSCTGFNVKKNYFYGVFTVNDKKHYLNLANVNI